MSGVTRIAAKVRTGDSTTSGKSVRGRDSQPMTAMTTIPLTTPGRRMARIVLPNSSVERRIRYATMGGWS